LGINYSTAKTILRIFRIEKRIEKKNADEERELKQIIYQFKKSKNQLEEGTVKNKVDSENAESANQNLKDNKGKIYAFKNFRSNRTINKSTS
jgi:hypothetical protein